VGFSSPYSIPLNQIWQEPLVHPVTILPVDGLNAVHHDNLKECY